LGAAANPPAPPKDPQPGEDAWWQESYFTILAAAASFAEPAALAELADFILKHKGKPLARDAMSAVTNHAQKEILAVCLKVLEGGTDDLKFLAVDHLTAIADRSAVDPLIRALKANEKSTGDLKARIGRALTVLTGQDYGESATNWEGWWGANKDKEIDVKAPSGGSTGTVTDALDRSRYTEFEMLKKTGKLLVISAGDKCKCGKNHDLDHIDQITSKMGLATETITKDEFDKKDDLKLGDYVAILANCTHIREHCACPLCKPGKYSGNRLFECECPKNEHIPVKYIMGDRGVARLKKYVEGGGYLFAEDWCMEDFVEKAFGDYVAHGSIRPKDESVPVMPKAGASSHPYLKKIFFRPPQETRDTVTETDLAKVAHTWKIDKETRTIRVKDPSAVTVLLTSPDLAKASNGDDAVAVTFGVTPVATASKGGSGNSRKDVSTGPVPEQDRKKMAGGRVLYVLSHFGKQDSQEDEFALQNLLINFLVEANERRGMYQPAPAPPKK
ncbi:MAG TPA: hypothetical protein VEN81_07955, partial [Planctomycetota bacterium]|nr:hypothetical protein [Planctomycetota bacterium]